MGYYMAQISVSQESLRALLENPSDRAEAAKQVVDALGGTFHHYFFALGDSDVVILAEFPDNETAMTCAMLVSGSGSVNSWKTTPLITSQDAVALMKKAGELGGTYKPPAG